MTIEERLAAVITALEEVGVSLLVLGGHAVRYYGVSRTTIDFDLHVAVPDWSALHEVLARSRLAPGAPLPEGPSWRPQVFRRFLLGSLEDGREEWLDLWRTNHLLAPFPEMAARCERGHYGGRQVPFLALPDLLRSKETERETDWQDIALLEEIQDLRAFAQPRTADAVVSGLASLRSRVGFDRACAERWFDDANLTRAGLERASHPVTRAYLIPFLAGAIVISDSGMIGEVLSGPLRKVEPQSTRHLALVEAVRRLHKQAAREADRADKRAAVRGP